MTGCPGPAGPSAVDSRPGGVSGPTWPGHPSPRGTALLGWSKPARCPAGRKNRQGSRADDRSPGPGRSLPLWTVGLGEFPARLGRGTLPRGGRRSWDGQNRLAVRQDKPAGECRRPLPGPGRTFRCGQLAWGSFRFALAWAPFPEGGSAPGAVKTDSLPGKVGKPTGDAGRPSRNDQILRPTRRPGSERHDRGQGPQRRKGWPAAPRPRPGRSGGGVSALPFPCGSGFRVAVALFMVGEICPRHRRNALKKGIICCIYKILYKLYLKIRRKRPLLHPLCRSGAEERPFCRQSTGRGETFSERRRTRPSPGPGGRRP